MKKLLAMLTLTVSVLSGCVGFVPVNDPVYSSGSVYQNDSRGNRDRDRDGVPNRIDRDRDGDGVRNRDDSRPNNPNRY